MITTEVTGVVDEAVRVKYVHEDGVTVIAVTQ